jgi:hypothetical protein
MSKTVKIINIMVFCTWVALISILLYKNYTGAQLERTQILKESFSKETHWYDIYKGTEKIGFAVTTFEKAGDEIIIKHEREMKVKKNEEETLLIEKLKCLSDLYYSIKSFEYTSNVKDEKGFKVSGEVDEDSIIFFLESPEKKKTYEISTNGRDFYLPITLIPVLHQKTQVPNTSLLIPMLDIVSLSIDDVRVVLEEIRPIKVGINILSLYKFRAGDSIIWSNERGIIIKEDNPSGITLYSQFENIAKESDDRILFDYTSLPFFKSNKLITNAEDLNLLRVKIKGYNFNPKLYKNSLVTLENDILTIEKQDIKQLKEKTYTLPYRKDNLNKYLSPDEWVLSNYRPLQDTGRIYARANNNDAFIFARYLSGYLYTLIKTMPVFVLSDSKNILKSLSGDYLERTIMFASYSRAAGLPTRLIGGLVYVNGYFYFHTWPEVWFGKWVPVDPTFAQFPADVTHIPLKQGTLKDIISIIDDLKNVKIEILEIS